MNLLKAVVEDFWDNSCHQGTAHLQTGVCVDLNQVQTEVFVNHEIITEKLKTVLQSGGVYL